MERKKIDFGKIFQIIRKKMHGTKDGKDIF